jgi:hypothetical protein
MGFFSQLFRRSLTQTQVEGYLDRVEDLSKLPYFLPAAERISMLSETASARVIGPGGSLHDRFIGLMDQLVHGALRAGANQIVRITPAWEALPHVLMTTCDFGGDAVGMTGARLLDAIRLGRKDFVVFANANTNVRERDPNRQMRLFFELVDNPRWAMILLMFSGSVIVRSSVLLKHPDSVAPATFQEMFSKLGSAAALEGKVRVFR